MDESAVGDVSAVYHARVWSLLSRREQNWVNDRTAALVISLLGTLWRVMHTNRVRWLTTEEKRREESLGRAPVVERMLQQPPERERGRERN